MLCRGWKEKVLRQGSHGRRKEFGCNIDCTFEVSLSK